MDAKSRLPVSDCETTTRNTMAYELPALPFPTNALEPHIDAKTMEIHHDKHHAAYVTNLNKALESAPDLSAKSAEDLIKNLSAVPEAIRGPVRNNGGGHVNHSFFWLILSPTGGGEPKGDLAAAIAKDFGSLDAFKSQFSEAAMKRFGSGWAWLGLKGGKLSVRSTANQDSLLSEGAAPIVGLDVWEHAYYLKHQNVRADYVEAFWSVVNWDQAGRNLAAARAAAKA